MMYTKAVKELSNVEVVDNDNFLCTGLYTMIAVVERIIRVDKGMEYRSVYDKSTQATLYKFAVANGSDGYHGFYEFFNWESACNSLYNDFEADALFPVQLYARWRKIKLQLDGEQVGGTRTDTEHHPSVDISITTVGCDLWNVEVLYE